MPTTPAIKVVDAGYANRAQQARDLGQQIDALNMGLEDGDRPPIFQRADPPKKYAVIYSMLDGEELYWPLKIVTACLSKRDPETGKFLFTANKEEAPEYVKGTTKCFLHKDSPDRVILDQIGMANILCPAGQLASTYSKRIHAQHRHKNQWEAYQDYIRDQEREMERQERRDQTDAMLAMAGKAAGVPTSEVLKCPDCEYEGTKQQVTGHRAAKHREATP